MSRLDTMTHYELLGVARDAEEHEIRQKYCNFSLNHLHDLFFTTSLGPFEVGIEQLLDRATLAYDTLISAERRAAYDGYITRHAKQHEGRGDLPAPNRHLVSLSSSTFTSAVPSSSTFTSVGCLRSHSRAPYSDPPRSCRSAGGPSRPPDPTQPEPAHAPNPPGPAHPRSPPGPAHPPNPPGPAHPPNPPGPEHAPNPREPDRPPTRSVGFPVPTRYAPARRSEEERELVRKMLAGKLVRGARSANSRLNPSEADDALARASHLRQFKSEDSQEAERPLSSPKKATRERLPAKVEPARTADQSVEALNALQLALAADPTNASLKTAFEEAKARVQEQLSTTHLERAERFLFTGHVAPAALEMARAADARPGDIDLQMRAVRLLVRAGEPGRAVRLAKKCLVLVPNCVDLRFDLARAFLAAGLKLAARREVRTLREMAPGDPRLAAIEKEL